MKTSFRLDPDFVAKTKLMGWFYRTRALKRGHKLFVSYNANHHTYHDVIFTTREFYPHARMTHEAPDGDMGGTVDINLNDS